MNLVSQSTLQYVRTNLESLTHFMRVYGRLWSNCQLQIKVAFSSLAWKVPGNLENYEGVEVSSSA